MSNSSFTYNTVIHLYETDAAQVIFFGKLSEICHRAFEDFFIQKGVSLNKIIFDKEIPYLFYVRHYECDFFEKITFFKKIVVVVNCGKIGNSSFTINFDFFDKKNGNKKLASSKIVYVCVDKKIEKKINIPQELINLLSSITPKK